MSSAVLVDTNLLVYAVDPRDRRKQELASALLKDLARGRRGVVSAQCLTEFGWAVLRSAGAIPVGPLDAQVDKFLGLSVLPLTREAIQSGLRAHRRHQLAYWDSFIWAVARLNDVPYILTEDGQHGRVVEGVTYLNPFVAGFVLPAAG